MKQIGDVMKRITAVFVITTLMLCSCSETETTDSKVTEESISSVAESVCDLSSAVDDTETIIGEVTFFDGARLELSYNNEKLCFDIPQDYYEDPTQKLLDTCIVNNPFGISVKAELICQKDKSELISADFISLNAEPVDVYAKIESIADNTVTVRYNGSVYTGAVAVKDMYSANYSKTALKNNYSICGVRFNNTDKLVLSQICAYEGIKNGYETYGTICYADKLYCAVVRDMTDDRLSVTVNSNQSRISVIPALYDGQIDKGDTVMLSRLSKTENDKTDDLCDDDICGVIAYEALSGELLSVSEDGKTFALTIQCNDKRVKLSAECIEDQNGQTANKDDIRAGMSIAVSADDIIYKKASEDYFYVKRVIIGK